MWCSDWFPVGASRRDGCEEECEQPKPVSSARPTECVRDVRIQKNGGRLSDWWDWARCEDPHWKRWMFVGLVGSDGSITIALFIKYLLGFIMRERRMTVCIYFSYIALYIFCVLGFQLSVPYVPKEFCWCWYQETVRIIDKTTWNIIKRCNNQYCYKVPQCQNLLFLLLYVFKRNLMAIIATNVKAKMLQPF